MAAAVEGEAIGPLEALAVEEVESTVRSVIAAEVAAPDRWRAFLVLRPRHSMLHGCWKSRAPSTEGLLPDPAHITSVKEHQ